MYKYVYYILNVGPLLHNVMYRLVSVTHCLYTIVPTQFDKIAL